jgi:hypothetical protein
LLEPWAFVFVLLPWKAWSCLMPTASGIAVLLAATATFFKETSILFLPPIWLLAMVDLQGRRPVLRRHAVAAGAAAITPFIAYYAIRRGLHIVRGYEVAGGARVWDRRPRGQNGSARRDISWARVGRSVWLVWLPGCACGFFFMRQGIRHHLVWGITAIGLVVFFAADVASIPFTGYGRFLAYPLLALCGCRVRHCGLAGTASANALIGATLVIAALQSFTATSVLALDFLPDYERNSLEWPQALVRFPIRSLSQRIPALASGRQVSKIRVIIFEMDLISLRVAYPDLARQYELLGDVQSPNASDCTCRSMDEAVVAGFEWPAHFAAISSGRQRLDQDQSGCLAQIRSTCASVALEQRADDAVIGAIGVGTR